MPLRGTPVRFANDEVRGPGFTRSRHDLPAHRAPGIRRRMPFTAPLWRHPGGWHFVRVPEALAPRPTEPWGRTPVLATVDGRSWETSVWRDKAHGTLLPVPARIRRAKGDGHLDTPQGPPLGQRRAPC